MIDVIDYAAVDNTARKISKRWVVVDYDDIRQELYMYILKHKKTFARYIQEDTMGKYYVALRNHATKYASGETEKVNMEHGRLAYSRHNVTCALSDAIVGTRLETTLIDNEVYNDSELCLTETLNTMLMDIRTAYMKLPLRTKQVLFYKYVAGYSGNSIVETMQLKSREQVYKISWSGIDEIVRYLNNNLYSITKSRI